MTHIAENWLIDWQPVTVMSETPPPRDPDDDDEGDNDEDEEDDEEDEPAVIREPNEDE
jgi:hypothetical protein